LDSRRAGRRSDLIYRAARHLDQIHLGRHRLAARRSAHRPQRLSRQGPNGAHQQQQRYSVERNAPRGEPAALPKPKSNSRYSLSNCDSKFSAACVLAAAA
jgi:hypothetical protein